MPYGIGPVPCPSSPLVASAPDPWSDDAGGAPLASSTPDALWGASPLRALRPAAVTCTDLRRGRELVHCSFSIPAGARMLLVSDPETAASTLVRAVAGLARIDGGRMWVAGSSDPTADGWGRRIAYLGQRAGLHDWMSPSELLALAGGLLGLTPAQVARRSHEVLAWTRISSGIAARPMRRGGEPLQQRAALAAALMGDPEVLLLDEPLRAIDGRERSRLLTLPGPRLTMILASRYPASEAGLVDRVAYLADGRIRMMAPIDALDRAGMPLSHRGIVALSDQTSAGAPTRKASAST